MKIDNFYLEQWRVCIESANRLETRRDNVNRLFIAISSTITAAFGYLFFQFKNGYGCLFLCTFVFLPILYFWRQLLSHFKLLATEKFKIIYHLEEKFEIKPMREELDEIRKNVNYKKIVEMQKYIPKFLVFIDAFGILFSILKIASIV